ncbi:hypothetical protein OH146_00165 [Salinibacterium sp. SYSU T00001]|nr:hypothetical protein [Salinibacterium sedimenticola]MCW4384184.1 hypothetical protein [Salinibacterium sedimenticola]
MEVMLVDDRATEHAIGAESELDGFEKGGLARVVVAEKHSVSRKRNFGLRYAAEVLHSDLR